MDAHDPADDSHSSLARFELLPPELQLRILALCDPQSLVRLAQASRACRHIARADSLWRNIALDIVHRHRAQQPNSVRSDPHARDAASTPSSWFHSAAFLLTHAHHLGYFASSQPFTYAHLTLAHSEVFSGEI